MAKDDSHQIAYMLTRTVFTAGRVFERGSIGPAEDFGDAFHPLRTAGFLERINPSLFAKRGRLSFGLGFRPR